MLPKISVLILNYKTFELTIEYVKNILLQENVELSILIVDNKSENRSYETMHSYFKDYNNVTVIESEWNGGYAYGNNFGFEYLENKDFDYLLVSNNDIELANNQLLYKMIQSYESLEKPAFVSPVQMVNATPYSPAWKQPTIWYDILTNFPIINKFIVKNNQYKWGNEQSHIPVDVLPGSFFFSKKEIIYKIGLMDSETFLYGEERILSFKVHKSNLQNYLLTNLEYEHKPSSTISSYVQKVKMLEMAHTSIIYYHEKYLKTSPFLIKILKVIYKTIRNRY